MPKKKKLAIIDSHALIHRGYHALPPMSTKDGTPTNAVYGFTAMLLKMFSTLKPTHAVAAFDLKGPTFRHKKFKDYKANRTAPPDELVEQFGLVRQVVEAFNIPILDKQGFEADDIIGTLVAKLDGSLEKIIITGDMDTLQLIDDDTSIFTLKRGISDTITYNEELVQEKYGFSSDLIPDYKGLRGDPSDNIPGVAGIGDKTAKQLVSQYGSIENIFKHFEELSTRAKTRLKGKQKEAIFSRELAIIKRDVPIDFKLEQAELADFDANKVRAVFEQLEFHRLLDRLPKSARGNIQPTLFEAGGDKNKKTTKLPDNYQLVETPAEQEELRQLLSKEKIIAFDTENDRLGARQYPIIGMSFAIRAKGKIRAWYVPVAPDTLEPWRELLESKQVGKVGHNLKYDMEVLAQSNINLQPIIYDTFLASYLLNPGARQHSLDALAAGELRHHAIPITDLIGTGKNQKSMSEVPLTDLARYAAEDADISLRLYEVLSKKVEQEKLTRVLMELELPLIPVLAHIELAGVKLDTKALTKLQKKVGARLQKIKEKILELAGEDFNINSTQQLRVILFEKLKLPTDGISRTQSGYSTAAKELDKLRGTHDIIELIQENRELSKLKNTYLDTLPKLADGTTGRVHASFNQAVTATGRLSSSDPNLQNIPARTDLGQEIRAAFIAEDSTSLIKADYSQLELRVVAHISQDKKMLDAFRNDADIHRSTAAWVLGIDPKEVTDKQRRDAKTLNFGVLYGMGPNNFSKAADISVEEARSFIERYHEQYAGITELIDATIVQAEGLGYVETLLGRRRYLPELKSNAPSIRAQAERAAFNFPIQGTAADILKKAMINLFKHMTSNYPEAKMILTVHDELVCEVPKAKSTKFAQAMKKIMEEVYQFDIPLIVEVSIGQNWRDMEKT